MNLLQMSPASGFESNDQWMSNALKRFTNNRLSIEEHHNELSALNNSKQTMEQNELYDSQETVSQTHVIESPPSVSLHANDRINLQAIITSTNIDMNGKFLLCRIVCEPRKFETLLTVVDDPEGECAVCVQIMFNFDSYKSNHSEEYLCVGTVLAIKNPLLRTAENGTLYIKCIDSADVWLILRGVRYDPNARLASNYIGLKEDMKRFLPQKVYQKLCTVKAVVLNQSTLDEIFPNLKWNGQIPEDLSFQQNGSVTLRDATNHKRIGNEHFAFKKYKIAIAAYTKAIQQGDDLVDLFCNRSASYMGISNYEAALTDAESALSIDKNHTKAICRKVKALFGMTLYTDAVTFLEQVSLDSIPSKDIKLITDLIVQGKSFIGQSEYGDYPWKDLYKNHNTYLELAEYTNEVIIKKSPINGRGLFATKMIKAGELILASKAFAVDKEVTNFDTKYDNGKSHAQLVLDIAQILADNPEKCKDLFCLYAGPDLDYMCPCECENAALMSKEFPIDIERIEAICNYNALHSESFSTQTLPLTNGLWIIPSFINHSCVNPNSTWRRIGDFLFVSAFCDIADGEEIVMAYTAPYVLSFSHSTMDLYGFTCNCRLCERDREDNETTKDYRADLLSQLKQILRTYEINGNHLQKRDETDILRFLKLLRRSNCDDSAPELNLIVVQPMLSFGSLLIHSRMFDKSADMFIDLYKIIENVACFCVYTVTVCVNIIIAYISSGEIIKAEKWVKILKERIRLAYGSVDIVDSMPSVTVAMMREYGLEI